MKKNKKHVKKKIIDELQQKTMEKKIAKESNWTHEKKRKIETKRKRKKGNKQRKHNIEKN